MAPTLLIVAMAALRAHTQKADRQITKQTGDFGFARLSQPAGCQQLHCSNNFVLQKNRRYPLTQNVFSEILLLNKNTKQIPATWWRRLFSPRA
jgi:hypothetical protein